MKIILTKLETEILRDICRNNAGMGGTVELNSDKWNNLANKFVKEKEGEQNA